MTKRKYISEDEEDEGYRDAECPECGAIINARFQHGRQWRRLRCPVCLNHVIISKEREPSDPLIQLRKKV